MFKERETALDRNAGGRPNAKAEGRQDPA